MTGRALLVVDSSPRDREGVQHFFEQRGFEVTAVEGSAEARSQLAKSKFAVALIDLDVGFPGGGVSLVRHVRETTNAAVVLLTSEASFEGAVQAMRAGAIDVVRKVPTELDHLAEVVTRASEQKRGGSGPDLGTLEEVRGVLDESFKVMLGLSRKVYAHLSLANAPLHPTLLVVDGDPDFLRQLSEQLGDKPWAVAAEMTGGAALDKGSTAPIHIVAARDSLMDLPGSMVIRSIQAQKPEVLGLLYSAEAGGKVEQLEQGRVLEQEAGFRGAAHLVEKLESLVEALGTRAEERRFIQAFSSDHRGFLRRYADLKLKIDRLLSG